MVIKSSDTIHKVKVTIQQAQNNWLSKELLKGDTINKIFKFIVISVSNRGLEPLIKNLLYIIQVEVSYFYKPAENMLNIFIFVPLIHPDNILQLFQLIPFPIAIGLQINSLIFPKLDKDFLAVEKTHPFLVKSFRKSYHVQNLVIPICFKLDK